MQKNDVIYRQAAIERATKDHDFFRMATIPTDKARRDELLNVICWLRELPSAPLVPLVQPESCEDVQHILDYLDEVLHPLVSPEHWNVYSELHDMIAALPSAQLNREKGQWINHRNDNGHNIADCNICGNSIQWFDGDEKPRFCCMCGARM